MYDGSLNFGDIMLRVAVALNIATYSTGTNNSAALPTDPNRLSRLKRVTNDGARKFCNSTRHPIENTTQRWTWLQPRVEIDFKTAGDGPMQWGADPTRAILPLGVCSAPKGQISWKNTDDNNGAGQVYNVSHDQVELLAARNPTLTGPPLYCTVKPGTSPKLGNRPGLELHIYPKPDRNITVGARFRIAPVEMIDLAERGIWPAVHDDTVIAFAIAAWKLEDGDDSGEARAIALLANSFDLDKEMHPKSLGQLSGSGSVNCPQSRTPLWNATTGSYLLT